MRALERASEGKDKMESQGQDQGKEQRGGEAWKGEEGAEAPVAAPMPKGTQVAPVG